MFRYCVSILLGGAWCWMMGGVLVAESERGGGREGIDVSLETADLGICSPERGMLLDLSVGLDSRQECGSNRVRHFAPLNKGKLCSEHVRSR